MTEAVHTTCPYCGVGCGLIATRSESGALRIRPDPDHPANLGRVCSKGAALAETVGLEGRLLHPMMDGKRVDWDAALSRVANGFAETVAAHGPDSVAFYVSGQLLTEDYYVANKLVKGFIGTANIDTNSRLCMASSVAGHKRAFGADTVPGSYRDLEDADLVVLVGSNAAWCHPVLYQRMVAAGQRNPFRRMVVIDPRRTASCEGADLHLAIRPGSDVILFNGLLRFLFDQGMADHAFVAAHTSGLEEALAAAGNAGIEGVAESCGIPVGDVARFYDWFAATARTVTLYSQGVNQSSAGADKVNAIINCHLLTGRIGKPGQGPFSLTGQPNAMGGREVGGLANQLAAHMEIENPAYRALVQRFWGAPAIADKHGLKAVALFDAIARGEVKAVWIMSTNPVVSLPDADRAAAALAKCDLVVVSDCMARTDTTAYADVVLPALAWGEKEGTVTNSERRISRQRAFLPAPGEARADWWIVTEVARRMGFAEAFPYRSAAEIFAEHAALSGLENRGTRDFDISALAGIDAAAYDALSPMQWPLAPGAPQGTARMFADGNFYTPDGRARFFPTPARAPVHAVDGDYPLILNTGRVRDHWHTMTRTGTSPTLSAHVDEPFLAVNSADAERFGLAEGGFAIVSSRWGGMTARVRIDDGQPPGIVFAPIHWNASFASHGRVGAVVNPVVDPVSGQPELKHTPVTVAPLAAAWQALMMTRDAPRVPRAGYWARARARGFWRTYLAGENLPENWDTWAQDMLDDGGAPSEWISYRDPASGCYRYALIRAGRLDACLFISPARNTEDCAWIAPLFAADKLQPQERMTILSGRPLTGAAGTGPIICACFGVGREHIRRAAAEGGLDTVEDIGKALGAGTNCGSCRSEIAAIIRARQDAIPVS